MPDVAFLPVLVAGIAAFALGGTYYAVLGEQLAAVSAAAAASEQPPPWKLAVELLRCLILAAVVAGLAVRGEVDEWSGRPAAGGSALDRPPAGALDRRRDPREHPLEARRDPRRRLAREAAGRRRDRERVAVARWSAPGAPAPVSSRPE
jgi:hypothetical protein